MRILPKLFDKHVEEEGPSYESPPTAVDCPHTILTARWDSVEDMGDESRATSFVCESCGEVLLPGEPRVEHRLAGLS
jgi:hypothetical protein